VGLFMGPGGSTAVVLRHPGRGEVRDHAYIGYDDWV
jgi:hypothetical protein